MAIIQYLERDYAPGEIKGIYRWIQKKLGMDKDHSLTKTTYTHATEDYYSPKYIVKLITEKKLNGKALFYFRNLNYHITLSSIGQFNVKGGEGDLFKPWGSSEFKNFKPSSIFQELEDEIIRINFIAASNGGGYSFGSYKEFINWLLEK